MAPRTPPAIASALFFLLGCSNGSTKPVPPDSGTDGSASADQHTASDGTGGFEARPDSAGDASPPASCSLDQTYTFYSDGGLRFYYDQSSLTPAQAHTVSRRYLSGDIRACSRELPCSDVPGTDAVTVPDILAAIAHADVQAALALATPPHYGTDPRPADGAIWVFRRADGRGFSIGPGDVPKGLGQLETLLEAVERTTVELPRCGLALAAADAGTDAR